MYCSEVLTADEHSTAQQSTAQHSTAQHSTAQHSTAHHSALRVYRRKVTVSARLPGSVAADRNNFDFQAYFTGFCEVYGTLRPGVRYQERNAKKE
jgi:hypothetical protein